MKNKSKLMMLAGAMALVLEATPALGQAPVIASFGRNGELVCTNLQPGTVASVEWASAVTGPWTNNWAGLDAVTVDSNGMIQVRVPMFYRVRGFGRGTNSSPSGMALIPAGNFMMGDTLDGTSYALPLHSVYVSAFYMDKYEGPKWGQTITLSVYDTAMPENRRSYGLTPTQVQRRAEIFFRKCLTGIFPLPNGSLWPMCSSFTELPGYENVLTD